MRSWPDKMRSALVTDYDADVAAALTSIRTVDLRTAMSRALLEYLSPTVSELGHRTIGFDGSDGSAVLQWGMPNDPGSYPCLVVNAGAPLVPVEGGMSPITVEVQEDPEVPGVLQFLRRLSEVDLKLSVMVWTTDAVSRLALCEALSDMLHPLDWMSGFRLSMPYYYGAQSSYLLEDEDWEDSQEAAANQRFVSVLSVQATSVRYVRVPTHSTLSLSTQLYIDGEEVAPRF